MIPLFENQEEREKYINNFIEGELIRIFNHWVDENLVAIY